MPTYAQLECHALFLLLLGFVMILFWVAVWGLTEDVIDEYVKTKGWTRRELYSLLLLGVLAFFTMYPRLLQRV
jgi:hypothetical protein